MEKISVTEIWGKVDKVIKRLAKILKNIEKLNNKVTTILGRDVEKKILCRFLKNNL